jgi:hypothetical protein
MISRISTLTTVITLVVIMIMLFVIQVERLYQEEERWSGEKESLQLERKQIEVCACAVMGENHVRYAHEQSGERKHIEVFT